MKLGQFNSIREMTNAEQKQADELEMQSRQADDAAFDFEYLG
jgi:hypothetical protein